MYKSFTALMALGMAAAAPTTLDAAPTTYHNMMSRQDTTSKLLIGTPAQILTADFTGSALKLTSTYHKTGTAPSWLLYKAPNLVYAVDENGADLNLFTLDAASSNPTLGPTVQGNTGVVSLAFNGEQTRIVGASYGTGNYDVWNIKADNSLEHFKQVALQGALGPDQTSHRAHQALLDPSGRYFVIPDLGGDALAVVDSENNSYEVVNTVATGTGSGPRHGGFISVDGGAQASHYIVATELSNELVLFTLKYGDGTIEFTEAQRLSTYGAAFPPAKPDTAAAGEIAISNGGHVYVSNRLSGNATDSIAHFTLEAGSDGAAALRFVDTVSTRGTVPRMFSLSTDAEQSHVFVANQGGELGIAAFKRDATTGSIDATPVASLPMADLVAEEFAGQPNVGPQFVQQI